jgi:hypothetical protein
MSAILDEQLELERQALENVEQLWAEADAMTPLRQPTPEAERTVAYLQPPPRPAFDLEAYRAGRRIETAMIQRRNTGAERSQAEIVALRHGVRAAMQLPNAQPVMIIATPKPRESRARRVVRRSARRSARSPDPDEPDPPLGGLA